jgi:asparagine synthase (glutamine-hydrolysing)
LYVTPQQALDVIPKLPSLYDEPFADASQIPTFLVSQLAREHVTVSLSGDGGDELFCGYSRYDLVVWQQQKVNKLPQPIRKLFKQLVNSIPEAVFNGLLFWAERYLTASEASGSVAYRLKILADVLNDNDIYKLYRFACSGWKTPNSLVIGATEIETPFDHSDDFSSRFAEDSRNGMMFIDQQAYLPDGILAKVDRAGMGVSLESRIPLLDHHIVEFAWRLPNAIKTHKGEAKWPLRDILYQHVPQKLVDRPKMGFGVPIDHWLRGPIKEWAEALLDEKRLRDEGYFNPQLIRQMWHEHCSNKADWQYTLWYVLIFQQWLEAQ